MAQPRIGSTHRRFTSMSTAPSLALTGTGAAPPRPVAPVSNLRLRRMGLQDLPFVVSTHLHYFPESFFARLGPRYMTRYYRTFLDGPLAAAVVAEVEGEVCGYLVGILDGPRHRGLLLRHHGAGLAWAGVWAMGMRPWLAWEFAFTRLGRYANALRRSRTGPTGPTAPTGPSSPRKVEKAAVLSHVAVREGCRRRGVGTQLINDFLQQAESAGCARVCLLTRAGSCGAGDYYESHQWERVEVPASSSAKPFVQYQRGLSRTCARSAPHVNAAATR